jgi:hypothetical protein
MKKNSMKSKAAFSKSAVLKQAPVLFLFFCLACFGSPPRLSAQDYGTIQISGAQGADFIVLSQGRRIVYGADRLQEGTVYLNAGDMLQTGPGSFAELRLQDGVSLLKAAENTSIRFDAEDGSPSLRLFYGRIRIKRPSPAPAFYAHTESQSVEMAGGDAAIDYILTPGSPSGKPAFLVSVFSGSIRVRTQGPVPLQEINAFETLRFEETPSFAWAEKGLVDDESLAYWNTHNFSDGGTLARPGVEPVREAEEQVREIPFTLPDTRILTRDDRIRRAALGTGILFSLAGLALQGAGFWHHENGNDDMTRMFMTGGGIFSGFGVLSLFGALRGPSAGHAAEPGP